jgi:uncharacterized protein
MIANRSAPPGPIVPVLGYMDVAKAIDWFRAAFGFTERLRTPPQPDGSIHHAQLATGGGAVILTSQAAPPHHEFIQSVMVRVENIDRHFERAKQFGARIVNPLGSHSFGERQYSAEDPEGRRWNFTQSVADVPPEQWGAQVANLQSPLALLPRPRFCYLEIPAADVRQSAVFYERVFGWNIRHRDTARPSFDDATGNISGAWVAGRTPAREPSLLPYIWVDHMDATMAQIAAHGGEMVEPPHYDSPGSTSSIATFRDPAGNLIGLYREGAR